MITRKAVDLAERARDTMRIDDANKFWNELIENCQPTKKDIVQHAVGVVVTTEVIATLLLASGLWDTQKPSSNGRKKKAEPPKEEE